METVANRELENQICRVYGERTHQVLRSMLEIPSRYYFRANSLRARREDVVHSMSSAGLDAEVDEVLDDAAFLSPHYNSIEIFGNVVEADRVAAEAVQLGAHLYSPGVRRCHGLRPGMKVTVIDENGISVGSGIAHQSETSILTYRQGLAVEIERCRSDLPSILETSWHSEGKIHLQSLPAILTSHVLEPRPGETIVDLNCAPGGKTSHVCQLTQNQARVIAFDRNKRKIRRTRELMQRMGCANHQLIPHDSRYVHLDYNIKADRVLVDPPCTALGIIPKLAIECTAKRVAGSAAYQKQFLTTASLITKKNGTIVYSVCTITQEECEGVVDFAETELGLILENQAPLIAEAGFDPERKTQRFNPDLHETGYFIARFTKR